MNRAYRRWRREVLFARCLARKRHRWGAYDDTFVRWRRHYDYEKKNSVTETITVKVRNKYDYDLMLQHQTRLEIDNRKSCSCTHCGNPRRSGFGNSARVLTYKEGAFIQSSVQDLKDEDIQYPNYNWKRRKWHSTW